MTVKDPSSNKPRPPWVEGLEEWIAGWWPGLILLAMAVLLWLGFSYRALGAIESRVLLVVFPIAMLGWAALAWRSMPRGPRIVGMAAIAIAAVAIEAWMVQILLPPEPFGTVTLSKSAPEATMPVPPGLAQMRVIVHSDISERTKADSVDYSIELRRGSADRSAYQSLSGQLSVSRHQGRSRGMPSETLTMHATEIHPVMLPGTGDMALRLHSSSGDNHPLLVSAARPPWGTRLFQGGLIAAMALAVMAEAMAARARRRREPLSPLIGMTVAFGFAVSSMFNPDMPLHFAIGAMLVSFAAGGIGGWLLGSIGVIMGRPSKPADTSAVGPR